MVPDLNKLNINSILSDICTITTVYVIRNNPDGTTTKKNYNLIPKAIYSLKVLQELPIIVVLMYELYKESIRQEVDDYIPIIIKTITLQPLKQHRYFFSLLVVRPQWAKHNSMWNNLPLHTGQPWATGCSVMYGPTFIRCPICVIMLLYCLSQSKKFPKIIYM